MNNKKFWEISPFSEAAMAGMTRFAPEIRIADCTLRDGEQQAGIILTPDDKLEIARALSDLGVYEIEAGTPASTKEDRNAVEAIAAAGLAAKVSALARPRHEDIDDIAKCGCWGVRLSAPISKIQRDSKNRLSDEQYLKLALDMSAYAKERGLYVIFSPVDTTRCDLAFLQRVLAEFDRVGCVDRVRLVDTTGCGTPHVIRYLVREMKKASVLPIEVHCHNDFGLAVANTIAGAEAGAEYLSVTVNGIGERAGNSALEEVVVALRVLYGIDLGMKTEKLLSVSKLVETLTNIPLQPNKAVVGSGAFAHESGMVVAALLKNPFTAETYVPELVGQERRIVFGKKTGTASVKAKLAELGLEATPDQLLLLVESIKAQATRTKQIVNDADFARMASKIVH
ncbi:MAG: homocitrate synthase [Bradyrhizobiaceae bacterium]|nr:homocitrate synthase [Bradyrhizobiaceae bacterium]